MLKKILLPVIVLLSLNAHSGAMDKALEDSFTAQSGLLGTNQVFGKSSALSDLRGYSTADRGHLRIPDRRLRLFNVNYVPPTITASCGKVSWDMGSFSMFTEENGKKLVEALKLIPAHAMTYAFEIALKNMCNTCVEVMKNIQAVMDAMNQDLGTSCNLSKQIVKGIAKSDSSSPGDIWDSITSQSKGGGLDNITNAITDNFGDDLTREVVSFKKVNGVKVTETKMVPTNNAARKAAWIKDRERYGEGVTNGIFGENLTTKQKNEKGIFGSGFQGVQDNTKSDAAQNEKASEGIKGKTTAQAGLPGNVVFQALIIDSAFGEIFSNGAGSDEETDQYELASMIISVAGTRTWAKDSTGGSKVLTPTFPALLNLNDFLNGSDNKQVSVWKCEGDGTGGFIENCETMSQEQAVVKGFKAKLTKLWLGDENDIMANPGIIRKLSEPNTYCADSPECITGSEYAAISSMGATSKSTVKNIMDLKHVGSAVQYFEGASDHLSMLMAYEFVDTIMEKVIRQIGALKIKAETAGGGKIETGYHSEVSQMMLERRKALRAEFAKMKTHINTQTTEINELYKAIKEYDDSISR